MLYSDSQFLVDYRTLLKFLHLEGYAQSYEDAEYILESISDDEFYSLYEYVILNPKIISHLISEGYADTYENAEQLLESLSDDEFDVLCERTFHGKQPGRAIQTTGPRRSGGDDSSSEPDLDAMRARFKEADAEEAAARQRPRTPSGGIPQGQASLRSGKRKPGGMARRRRDDLITRARTETDSQRYNDLQTRITNINNALERKKKWGTPEAAKEEYILNYLMIEGYADSYEQAEEILIHMSDLWEESILNEAAKDQSDKQKDGSY
jgi:hypothetical protein